jgi:hypothetical protein
MNVQKTGGQHEKTGPDLTMWLRFHPAQSVTLIFDSTGHSNHPKERAQCKIFFENVSGFFLTSRPAKK